MIEGVSHPSHYNVEGRKECIVEMQEKFGRLGVYFFDRGNSFKYEYRAGMKKNESSTKDLEKACWYDEHSRSVSSSWNFIQQFVLWVAMKICF